jgi:hypothetical protein
MGRRVLCGVAERRNFPLGNDCRPGAVVSNSSASVAAQCEPHAAFILAPSPLPGEVIYLGSDQYARLAAVARLVQVMTAGHPVPKPKQKKDDDGLITIEDLKRLINATQEDGGEKGTVEHNEDLTIKNATMAGQPVDLS